MQPNVASALAFTEFLLSLSMQWLAGQHLGAPESTHEELEQRGALSLELGVQDSGL